LIVVADIAIADVSAWEVRFLEPGGGDANVWLIDPETDEYALFKPAGPKSRGADRRSSRSHLHV
jgi:hypothetical protein